MGEVLLDKPTDNRLLYGIISHGLADRLYIQISHRVV